MGFDEFAKKPIGAGPYKFVRYIPGEKVVLEAHEQWFEGPPQVKTIDYMAVPEDTTRVAMILTGEADIALALPPQDLSRVERTPGLKVSTAPIYMTGVIMYQAGAKTIPGTDKPNPFADVRVRRALAHAIDLKTIVERIGGRSAKAVKGPIASYTPGYDDNVVEYEYDPKKARRLLEEANYPFGEPFKLNTYLISPPLPKAMEAVTVYWQAIGANISFTLWEFGAFGQQRIAKQRDQSIPGLWPIGGQRSITLGPRLIWTYMNSKDGSFPAGDPKLDALFERAYLAYEPQAREEANKLAWRYLHEQAYRITLYEMIENHGLGPRVDWNFPPHYTRTSYLNLVTWRPGYP